MRQATLKLPHKRPWILQFAKRIREATLILWLAVSCFLTLALVSYQSSDPGWSHTGEGEQVLNLAGITGAWLADIFFSLIGWVAYLIPLAMIYGAVRFYRENPGQLWGGGALWGLRGVGTLLAVLSSCGLISLHWTHLGHGLPMSTGGVFGAYIEAFMVNRLNHTGSTVILLAFLLTGITLFTGLSWLAVMDFIGKYSFRALGGLHLGVKHLIKQLAHRFKQRSFSAPKSLSMLRIPQQVSKPSAGYSESKTNIPTPDPKFEPVEPTNPTVSPPKSKLRRIKKDLKKKTKTQTPQKSLDTKVPSLNLLDGIEEVKKSGFSEAQLEELSRLVESRLMEFGVKVQVVSVHPGPVITRFDMELAPGLKVSKITGLAKDLARSLSVISVRVVEVIPGKAFVGLEIPNLHREIVRLKDILESNSYQNARSPLSLTLGKDIAGKAVVTDLAKMPHLLVAGTTGSGKSVGLNAMLLSILYKSTPEEVRFILIDPKMLELAVYDGIPHLLTPVVTDMKDAANSLRWCVGEMERRYQLMAALGVRNLAGFNQKIKHAQDKGEPIMDPLWTPETQESPEALSPLPFIVVLIDEFADMMMVVGKKVEELIARIAQKARAAGIHLILATQRPSVDVITGLIKANVPTRIAFQVSSKIDSRTILDQPGAEQLLGHGDMLFLPPGVGVPMRIHGAFVTDDEVHKVTNAWRAEGPPEYIDNLVTPSVMPMGGHEEEEVDELYDHAVAFVTQTRKASISSVQRKLKIGYNRAARLIEQMEAQGVVSPMQSNGSREVLAPPPPEKIA